MTNPKLIWPPEDIEHLTKRWNEDKQTALVIARELKRTRNSVIGMARRLGLEKRIMNGQKLVRSEPRRPTSDNGGRVKKKKVKTGTVVAPARIAEPGEGVRLLQLRRRHCRDIIGYDDGDLSRAVYCGNPPHKNTAYCEYHHAINCVPPEERRRR